MGKAYDDKDGKPYDAAYALDIWQQRSNEAERFRVYTVQNSIDSIDIIGLISWQS